MWIDAGTIISVASLIAAVIAIFGVIFAVYRWYLRQGQQDEDIKTIKEEQALVVYGLLAALKGLHEQGCNGPVTDAINKLEKHINIEAHK